jgi:hypothetical protein
MPVGQGEVRARVIPNANMVIAIAHPDPGRFQAPKS